ncbi:cytochrome C biogenesis protein CcdA [Virgibacillus phasianinus]|uniref:Cytochrome C biogenesis protein CcdA n=1 Tax=Virgibacillus phasianinus TaxID=2017483 RepID=A0A220TZX1_9BACI|nr:cytochrome c biogenesis protein CcdA [Virgibacillus phasianinus]ASK61339.1 cytochrome C biogenesis protein CcdA [Virgibacillus phasianinus]
MEDVNLLLALAAGVLSFVSPCCLPLYPAFLSYITGMSVDEIKNEKGMLQKRALLHTIFFLIGFSIIFIALGFSTSLLGTLFTSYGDLIRQLGAVLLVALGLVIMGVYKPAFMMKEKRMTFKDRPSGYLGSSVIGFAFAAGWTPCMGPILAGVITLGVSNPDQALFYMIAYVLGFSIPFFIMSFFIGKMRWIKRHNRLMMKIGGGTMIFMGILLFFDLLTKLTSFLASNFFNGFTGF